MNDELVNKINKLKKECFEIRVKVEQDGKMPTRAHFGDAGADVYATSDITIYPGQVQSHPLNIRLDLPKGTWAEIASKSGLGKKGLLVYAGVIDQGYKGIVHVVMSNISLISHIDQEGFPIMRTEPIIIKKGEKVAQLIMNPYHDQYEFVQVDDIDANSSSRGEGGFGSSGK